MSRKPKPLSLDEVLRSRARVLGLWGVLARWEDFGAAPWLPQVLEAEEIERGRRSLERRLRNARIGRFKPMADFDWDWPARIDRELVEDLLRLDFLALGEHAVLVGPNGVGKTTIAQNIAHLALLAGPTVQFTTASQMLNELAGQDGPTALARRLRRYTNPDLLVIDEIGYLAYDARLADLLFEVVSRRREQRSMVVTTNRPFAEWGEVFPNATCVVALVDRLVHRAQIAAIEGESYRLKEAKEREAERKKSRKTKRRAASPA